MSYKDSKELLIKNSQSLFILCLLFFTFSFLYRTDEAFDQDLGRHIILGKIILETGSVPTSNLFSYTNPDFPFINHHWLFEVIVYLGSITIGIDAMLVGKISIILLSVAIALLLTKKHPSIFFFSIGFIFLHMLRGRVELRPEIFSYLFTVLTFLILETFATRKTKVVYFLPFISLFWVNMHIYYPVGLFLQMIYLGSMIIPQLKTKKWHVLQIEKVRILGVIFLSSICMLIINPNGIRGALYAFTVFNNYGVTITENQTVGTLQRSGFINPDFLFLYLCLLIIFGAIAYSLWNKKITFKNIGILLLGVGLAMQSIRGFPYLVFLCLPVVLWIVDVKKMSVWVWILNGVIGVFLCIESIFYLSGEYAQMTYRNNTPTLISVAHAEKAMDFFTMINAPQPIFNNFDIGSYIIYRTYPRYKVFIDGRPEAYPSSFFTETYLPMQENYEMFKNEAKKWGFRTIIFSIMDQNPRTVNFLYEVIHDPAYKLVYLDDFMVILLRTDEAEKRSLPPVELATLRLTDFRYSNVVSYTNISTFLYNMKEYKKAKEFNQQALRIEPLNPAANKIMANILLREKKVNLRRVDEYLQKTENGVFW